MASRKAQRNWMHDHFLKSGHVMRVVGLDNYDDLRGSGLFFLIIDEWRLWRAAWEEVLRPMLSTCKYIVNGEQRVGASCLKDWYTERLFNHCYDTFMDGQPGHEPDCRSFSYTSLQGGNIPESEIIVAKRKMTRKHSVRNMKPAWKLSGRYLLLL